MLGLLDASLCTLCHPCTSARCAHALQVYLVVRKVFPDGRAEFGKLCLVVRGCWWQGVGWRRSVAGGRQPTRCLPSFCAFVGILLSLTSAAVLLPQPSCCCGPAAPDCGAGPGGQRAAGQDGGCGADGRGRQPDQQEPVGAQRAAAGATWRAVGLLLLLLTVIRKLFLLLISAAAADHQPDAGMLAM